MMSKKDTHFPSRLRDPIGVEEIRVSAEEGSGNLQGKASGDGEGWQPRVAEQCGKSRCLCLLGHQMGLFLRVF